MGVPLWWVTVLRFHVGPLVRQRLRALLAIAGLAVFACGVPDYQISADAGSSGSGGSGPDGGGTGGAGTGGTGGGSGGDASAGCSSDADCDAASGTPVCDKSKGSCVECLPGNDTCPFGSYCAGTSCVLGCGDDQDCASDGGSLTCNTTTHVCIGCSADTDCPPGSRCEQSTSSCVAGCTTSASCPSGFDCCDQQCVNTDTSKDHCGGCGQPCTNANGTTDCSGGACKPACAAGFGDCNSNANDGCETDVSSPGNCGGCGAVCSGVNGTPTCSSGSCQILCNSGFADCDNNALVNGCEIDLKTDSFNCGSCANKCPSATPNCSNGSCVTGCATGYGDCDGNALNGCEANLTTSGQNCGACNNACTSTQYCNGGGCAACPGGSSDCDKNGSNACESTLSGDPNNCGSCGNRCGADGTCGCSGSSCSGGTVYFSEDFSDNSKGWTLGAEWGIGPTQTSTGHQQGSPDPSQDHSTSGDNGVAGIVIGGNYDNGVHPASYLTSPVINLSSAGGTVKLTFWHWLNCDWSPFVLDTVEVYNGTGWTTVWSSSSAGKNLITENSWSRRELDVTAYKNANFRIRFGHLTGKQGNYLAWIMSGWNIDDLSLSSATCN
jgi:hypothetical protein